MTPLTGASPAGVCAGGAQAQIRSHRNVAALAIEPGCHSRAVEACVQTQALVLRRDNHLEDRVQRNALEIRGHFAVDRE